MTRRPLDDVTVIDLTHSWAGPHATRVLADYGAQVIVVEYPRRLGMHRGGRKDDRIYNRQPAWFQVNRNKYSLTLDLREPAGRAIFTDLVRQADVLMENGRAGVMSRLGLAYEDLIQIKPDLVMLSMPAYGSDGPYATYPAYGGALEVMSGIQNLTGYAPGGTPHRVKELDVINGLGAASAVLTALMYRLRTGQGQHIDLAQWEFSTHALLGEHLLEFMTTGQHAPPLGNRHRRFAPQGCYPCRDDDRYVTLTVTSDSQWPRFCEAVGRPEWQDDPRLSTAEGRRAHHDELDEQIAAWSRQRSHVEAVQALQAHGIASGAVHTVADLAADPHLEARGYFVRHAAGTDKPLMGLPFHLSRTDGAVRWRGPDLGAHNEAIICEKLGRPASDVAPLDEETIGTAYDSQ